MRVLFIFLVLTTSALGQFKSFVNETQYCRTCHVSTSSWLQGKAKVLRRWVNEDEPKQLGHHWWFKKETFSSLLKLRATQKDCDEPSFYRSLARLEDDYDGKAWQELMARGQTEVPGFRTIWQQSLRLPHTSESLESAIFAIREPFSKLHFKKGQKFHYHSSHRMHVGKILLFFGGMREFSLSETLFRVINRGENRYEMTTSYGARGKPAPLHAAFTIDAAGTLVSIDKYVPFEDFRLKNLADIFSRGGGNRFGSFSFEKTIFLKKRSRMTRSSVDVVVTINVDGMSTVQDEPCLIGSFTIREKPDGHRDRFTIWGKGRFVHLPNGLVACQETRLKFRIKLFGIPLVKGSVIGRSWLAPDSKEQGPYRPSVFGWCKED